MGVGVKKRATPSTAKITEAIVSRTAQISNRNTSRAARRDNAKAKGATNIFSSIIKKEKELLRALLGQFCKLEFI